MKLPDFFYIKQARTLNELHARSVNLLAKLYSRTNPQNAYDSEWGEKHISGFVEDVSMFQILSSEQTDRLLRQRITSPSFTHRPELDRDILRMETLQSNIEYELGQLSLKKAALIGWIQAVTLLSILTCQLIKLGFP